MDVDFTLDTSGLACPMPLLKTKQALSRLASGELLKVIATDQGSKRDIPAFIGLTDHQLAGSEEADGNYVFFIRKG